MGSYAEMYDSITAVKNKFSPPAVQFVIDYVTTTLRDTITNAIPSNEGYAQACCLPIVASIVSQYNTEHSTNLKYEVYPVVYKCFADQRKNKKSDYSIYNGRTLVLIECKKTLGALLSDKQLAQLFLEAIYVKQNDKNTYTKLLCILTDGATFWHCLEVDMPLQKLTISNYLLVHLDIPTLDSGIQQLVNIINHYITTS